MSWTIGQLARRAGVATSALRYYETLGLIHSERTDGNQRRYEPAQLRRVAVIRAAQELGISLAEVGEALDGLPERRTPHTEDWAAMSRAWRGRLDDRIDYLQRLRDDLDGCIGCGCLSLKTCALLNPDDRVGGNGPGARYLLGDHKPAVTGKG